MKEVIVLGSGPAGLTAALYIARANLSPLLFHGPLSGGQLTTTTMVENFPGFSKGIMGPDLMEEMRLQAGRFGTEFQQKTITKVDFSKRPFKVYVDDEVFEAKSIIISSGASSKTLNLEREAEMMGYGLSTCATCDGAFFNGQEIIVIGGGDSACEEALFLTKFGSRVRLIHRRNELRASKIMVDRVLAHPKIEVVWNHTMTKLLGDKKSGITGAVLKDTTNGKEQEIQCNAIFYGIGHVPNTQLFMGQLDMDENKYLITKADSTKTNIPGIFACGDVQDHIFRQAITAAGSGCMAAIETERWLVEEA